MPRAYPLDDYLNDFRLLVRNDTPEEPFRVLSNLPRVSAHMRQQYGDEGSARASRFITALHYVAQHAEALRLDLQATDARDTLAAVHHFLIEPATLPRTFPSPAAVLAYLASPDTTT